jgi:hypothetical protein
MRKKLQLFIILLFASATCFAQAKIDSAVAMHYKTNDFDCAIFPASADAFIPAVTRFTPTQQEVEKAELALKTQLEALNTPMVNQPKGCPVIHKNLKNYGRQYFGYTDSLGHRILYINCIWKKGEDAAEFKDHFLKNMIHALDGCSYYWVVRYYIDTGKLFNLYINGQG